MPPSPQTLFIIAPALPPQLDGIGDYTAQLAREISGAATVKLLVPGGTPHAMQKRHRVGAPIRAERPSYHPLPGVEIEPCFSVEQTRSFWRIAEIVEAARPDWLLLQYNPFSYGPRGLNLHLPQMLRAVKRRCPATRFAVMFHECYLPIWNWRFAVMTTWQRWQFWLLGSTADVLFFSIEAWAQKYRRWFPGKPVRHLPVGSNIPLVGMPRHEARARLGLPEKTLVLGLFGTAHVSRQMRWVREAAEAVRDQGREVLVLYIGPEGEAIREGLGGIPMLDSGPLPPDEVSRRFAAVDVALAPFIDGVSTRRTSLMTGLQHGVATVGTRGPLTDRILQDQDGRALLLSDVKTPRPFCKDVLDLLDRPERRLALGREGQRLYEEEFAWERIASGLLSALATDRLPCQTDLVVPG